MFENSYKEMVNAELEMTTFAKKTEDYLYPVIDQAIRDKKNISKITALISSLPFEDSRNKYLHFLNNQTIEKQDKKSFIPKFYNNEFYDLKIKLEKNIHKHMDEVMNKFQDLLHNNDKENIIKMTEDKYICNIAKLMIIEHIIDI